MSHMSDVRNALSHFGYRERHEGIYSRIVQEGWAFWVGYTGSSNPLMLLSGVCSKEFFDLLESCMAAMRLPVPKSLRLAFDTTPVFSVRTDAFFSANASGYTAPDFVEVLDRIEMWLTAKVNYGECLDALEAHCKHKHIYTYHKPVLLTLLGREEEREVYFDRWLSQIVSEPEIVRSSIVSFVSELRKKRDYFEPIRASL